MRPLLFASLLIFISAAPAHADPPTHGSIAVVADRFAVEASSLATLGGSNRTIFVEAAPDRSDAARDLASQVAARLLWDPRVVVTDGHEPADFLVSIDVTDLAD